LLKFAESKELHWRDGDVVLLVALSGNVALDYKMAQRSSGPSPNKHWINSAKDCL